MSSDSISISVRRGKPFYHDLSVQILLAMLAGIAVGYLWPGSADAMKPLGDLFIRLVRMLVAPIIFCTVVHGIASARNAGRVGRVAAKAIIYFELVTSLGLFVALVLVNLWTPGAGMKVDLASFAGKDLNSVTQSASQVGFSQLILGIVPTSFVGAFADGDVLPVLFVSLLFAFGLLSLGDRGKPVIAMIQSVSQVLFKMIGFVMYVAPVGAFGAIAFTVGKYGPSSLIALGKLVGEFYVCCLVFVLLILWPIAFAFGIRFFALIRYIGAELLIVAGTSSGESVFPRLNARLRALGCDEAVVALVLPAGYAFNHDGTCLYYATVSVFLAQALGIDLTLGQQLALLGVMLLTSMGGAGVAGSAIVMLATTLSATGAIPVAAVGLILGVHRLLSSAFVPVNVLGNSLATIIIARLERALDVPLMEAQLSELAPAE